MKIKFAETPEEWEKYHQLREKLLFLNYGRMNYDRKHPSLTDPNHYHFVMYDGRDIVTIGHIQFLTGEKAALRSLATDEQHQMRGLGAQALAYLENWVKEQGRKMIIMHAARPAVGFYRRMGYNNMDFSDDMAANPNHVDLGKVLS